MALIAVAVGASILRQRARRFERKAVEAAGYEQFWRRAVAEYVEYAAECRRRVAEIRNRAERTGELAQGDASDSEDDGLHAQQWQAEADLMMQNAARTRPLITYYAALRSKYRRAASRPWESVQPDSLPPAISPELLSAP